MGKLQAKRGNLYKLPIEDIDADEKLRGRHKPPKQSDIEALAHSINDHGQLQPVKVRKVGGRYKLILGFTRYDAIKWGNETGLFNPPLPIECTLSTTNDEESFTRNVVENRHRNQTTPIDDAYNIRKLSEDYGKTDKEIAELYGLSQAYIGQLKKLLVLDKKTQDKISDGELPLSAALLLVKSGMEEKDLPGLLEACTNEKGKVETSTLRATLRELPNFDEDDPEDEEETEHDKEAVEDIFSKPAPKKKTTKKKSSGGPDKKQPKYPRTLSEIKKYWKEQTEIVDPSPAVGEFATKLVKFLEGDLSNRQMDNAFGKLYDQIKAELEAGE